MKIKVFLSLYPSPNTKLIMVYFVFQGESWTLNVVCSKDSDDYQDETLDLGVSLKSLGTFRTWNIFDSLGSWQLLGFECSLHSGARGGKGDRRGGESWRTGPRPKFSSNTVQSCLTVWSNRSILTFSIGNNISHQGYEKRYYPPATFVCNKTSIDTADDPFAGLDDENPFVLMSSRRYQKRHESQMFMELFRYIAGVNQVNTALIMNKKENYKNILEARKNRDDQTGGRLPQRDEGDAPRELRGSLYVFLPSLQVPGWPRPQWWEIIPSCCWSSPTASWQWGRLSLHCSCTPCVRQVTSDQF